MEWSKIPFVTPFVGPHDYGKDHPPTAKEIAQMVEEGNRTKRFEQYLENRLTDFVVQKEFSLPPYYTADPSPFHTVKRETISVSSQVDMSTTIHTYKEGDLVVFQVRSAIDGYVRTDFGKSTLLRVKFVDRETGKYVVEEKNAMKAINQVAEQNARDAFGAMFTQYAIPVDRQTELGWDPAKNVRESPRAPSAGYSNE